MYAEFESLKKWMDTKVLPGALPGLMKHAVGDKSEPSVGLFKRIVCLVHRFCSKDPRSSGWSSSSGRQED